MITHHHKDHIGGVNELKEYYNNLQVFSSIPEIATHTIIDGQVIKLETLNNLTFNVMTVPGHTLDHIVFHGNGGYDWETVYHMPLWLRRTTFNLLKDHYDKEQEAMEKQQNMLKNKSGNKEISRPNIAQTPTYTTKAAKK